MLISYKWLLDYLPTPVAPEKCAEILTSIGLEVEGVTSGNNALDGLLVGEVLSVEAHPNADKLKITSVNIGNGQPLQIVCGAKNVAAGQKVVVAPVNTILHPVKGEPLTIKKAQIRGVESAGMLCAEDEIGIGTSHDGIMVLPENAEPGMAFSAFSNQQSDTVFEIGLTPNRSDAMSHYGVARDICAYLSHHEDRQLSPVFPASEISTSSNTPVTVTIEDPYACMRYSGISITGLTVSESPDWLKERISSIGLKPINSIVDITNYILHETGQPLHAFDGAKITGNKVIVKKLPEGSAFTTLDGKDRTLSSDDLMICNETAPMCIAGVYGGLESGVTSSTTEIFLESACFNSDSIRRTSFRHGLRTDAATRFEKGTDISRTTDVLKRAAAMICEITGGKISGDIIDIYPVKKEKTAVTLSWEYLQKISGKEYSRSKVRNLLINLGYEITQEDADKFTCLVPYYKPSISYAADLVQEVMRIDGLNNIEIPSTISIAPAIEKKSDKYLLKEKVSNLLTYSGMFEIFTNSITNSKNFSETELSTGVKMINSLSADLDMMRPDMLPGGLQAIAYNLNRKNPNLRFYEFGKTYHNDGGNTYKEVPHLSIFLCGSLNEWDWKHKTAPSDFYTLKGIAAKLFETAGVHPRYQESTNLKLAAGLDILVNNEVIGYIGELQPAYLKKFDIKVPVYYMDIAWEAIEANISSNIRYKEFSKFPSAQRDLSVIIDKQVPYSEIERITKQAGLQKLDAVQLFDVFESEKIGSNKKSLAIKYTFVDESGTLTDAEMDTMINKLILSYEKEIQAEIRKQ